MDAIAGNMKVRGYTDLTTESLNYDIRFVPQLASVYRLWYCSVPVRGHSVWAHLP